MSLLCSRIGHSTAVMVGTGVGASQGVLIKGDQALESAHKANSEHPFAKAIVECAKKFREDEENPAWPEAQDFKSISSHGLKATVRNNELSVGNKSLMLGENIVVSRC